MKPRPFLQGAGLATLYITLYAANFLNSTLGDAYHRFFPLTTIYRAIFFMTLLLWLGGGLAFLVLEGLSLWWKRILWILPIVLLPLLFFRSMSATLSEFPRIAIAARGLEHALTPAIAVAVLSLLFAASRSPVTSRISRVASRIYDGSIRGTRICYMVAGFGLCVILPRIGLHALQSAPPESPGFQRAGLPAVSPSSPRIVWILMDELSYDQVFDSRQPDVLLPNFDRLARSSVIFSDLQPPAAAPGPGAATETVVPSLLLGKVIVDLRKPYPGPPSYRSIPGGAWQPFNERDTIFASAHSLGWTTGVAGWYNPYCRLLPHVLDRCVWVLSEPLRADQAGGLSTNHSISENLSVMMPFHRTVIHLIHGSTNEFVRTHINDYVSVMSYAKELIRDSRIRFVFIHLPIPHPPGIYDRVQQSIGDHGTYLDNLVLADRSLAALQDVIQSTPAAANTTLIVSSDHSWRTYMWKGTPAWSAEAMRSTQGGKFDPRPVLIVHLPGEDGRQILAKPVKLLMVHDIVEALLRGQLHTMADIKIFTDRQPQETENAQRGN